MDYPTMISIITPTYNECDGIENFVSSITKTMRELNTPFEIIVVDDNSPDGTAAVVTKLRATHNNLVLVQRQGKLGIGSAYFDGFSSAKGDYLIGIDADLSPSLDAIKPMIEKLKQGYGMVIGSRYLPKSRIYNMTKFKSGGSKLFNLFARNVLRIPLTDITHSNRALSAKAFRKIAPHITETGHPAYFIECSFWAHKLGERITEVPITFTERVVGASKLDLNKGLRHALYTIWRLRRLQ